MSSKYDDLSGVASPTNTPYGMLVDIILFTKIRIWICGDRFSLDTVEWEPMNKGLSKRLHEMAEYMDRITVVKHIDEAKIDDDYYKNFIDTEVKI